MRVELVSTVALSCDVDKFIKEFSTEFAQWCEDGEQTIEDTDERGRQIFVSEQIHELGGDDIRFYYPEIFREIDDDFEIVTI
jgi:hypothetical protein